MGRADLGDGGESAAGHLKVLATLRRSWGATVLAVMGATITRRAQLPLDPESLRLRVGDPLQHPVELGVALLVALLALLGRLGTGELLSHRRPDNHVLTETASTMIAHVAQ
jgi:hypothetical protein